MARSDGYGTRPGHPAPQRLGQPQDQSAAPQHGSQPAGWQDGGGYGSQFPQDPYWQQPVPPNGYEPVAPPHPSAPGGLGHPIEPMAPDPHYPAPPQHNPYAGGQDGYHYPQAPGFDPYEPGSQPRLGVPNPGNGPAGYGAPEFPGFSEPAQSGYAPPYETQQYQPNREPHLDQSRGFPSAGNAHDQFQDYLAPTPPPMAEEPGYSNLNPHASFDAERPGLRGSEFEDWPRDDDPGNRDFGGYDPSSQFAPTAAAHGDYADSGWGQHEGNTNFALDSGPIFASAGYDTTQDLALHTEYDDEDEYEDDEPAERPRSRIGWILMALTGAVMIGGGLAYGYKVVLGPSATQVASTPVVKGTSQPPKVRPDDPGGRSFDHTDSKILGRLSEPRSSGTAEDGSRRVSTVMIGRNGDIVAPRTAPTPSATPPDNPVVAVPGLTLVDGFGGRPAVTPTAAENVPQRPIVVQPPESTGPRSPARPVVIARTEPTTSARSGTAAAPPPTAKPAETAERVTARAAAAATAPKNTAPVTTASTSAPATASAGYVAVLASVPVSATSRVDALAQYADIQQNYGSVLASRTPDVREANLGSRGRYHRLMVGPPGSKESAAQLCSQLKSAGYSGCWITTY